MLLATRGSARTSQSSLAFDAPTLANANMISQGGIVNVKLREGSHVEVDGFCRSLYLAEFDTATIRRRSQFPTMSLAPFWRACFDNFSPATLQPEVIQSVIIDSIDNDKAMTAPFQDTTGEQPLGPDETTLGRTF